MVCPGCRVSNYVIVLRNKAKMQEKSRETNRRTPGSYRMDMIVLRSKGRRKYKSSLGRAVRMTRRKLKTPCGHVRNSRFIAPETELAIAFTPSQSVRAIAKTKKVSKDELSASNPEYVD